VPSLPPTPHHLTLMIQMPSQRPSKLKEKLLKLETKDPEPSQAPAKKELLANKPRKMTNKPQSSTRKRLSIPMTLMKNLQKKKPPRKPPQLKESQLLRKRRQPVAMMNLQAKMSKFWPKENKPQRKLLAHQRMRTPRKKSRPKLLQESNPTCPMERKERRMTKKKKKIMERKKSSLKTYPSNMKKMTSKPFSANMVKLPILNLSDNKTANQEASVSLNFPHLLRPRKLLQPTDWRLKVELLPSISQAVSPWQAMIGNHSVPDPKVALHSVVPLVDPLLYSSVTSALKAQSHL
jgi:hypothetical protein